MEYSLRLEAAFEFVSEKLREAGIRPEVGIILGSGLGELAGQLEKPATIDYRDIPHFPPPTVAGHVGRFVAGTLQGCPVMMMQGRYHYYEGHSMQDIVLPVRVMALLGIKTLIVTNAAGGLVPTLHPGDLMVISDHINLMFDNPLIGPNLERLGPRFVATRNSYSQKLMELAFNVAEEEGIRLAEGVYIATTGPVYETAATGNFFRLIGGHAVGMSTVPEVIAAVHAGMQVLAVSCITDSVSEKRRGGLTHKKVLAVAEQAGPQLAKLIRGVVARL